jgi:hypothetical protein
MGETFAVTVYFVDSITKFFLLPPLGSIPILKGLPVRQLFALVIG